MPSCIRFGHRTSKRRPDNDAPKRGVETMEIYTTTPSGWTLWRIALLSFDIAMTSNLISPKLVTEILGMDIHTWSIKEGAPVENWQGQTLSTQGYVDIVWGLQRTRPVRCTRFAVTAIYDPPFDAVLGREAMEDEGLTRRSDINSAPFCSSSR